MTSKSVRILYYGADDFHYSTTKFVSNSDSGIMKDFTIFATQKKNIYQILISCADGHTYSHTFNPATKEEKVISNKISIAKNVAESGVCVSNMYIRNSECMFVSHKNGDCYMG
jgi:hypothetical protein